MTSSLGRQVSSTTPTAPAFSLASRVTLPAGHGTPGPGTYDRAAPDAVGKQPLSQHRTLPAPSIGGRPHSSPARRRLTGDDAPGPGWYDTPGALGKQPASVHTTAPAYSLAPRLEEKDETASPGPGAYEAPPAVGPQVMSTRKTAPAPTMRDRRLHSTSSAPGVPGPGSYDPTPATAGQEPGFSLAGRDYHDLRDIADELGPGQCRVDSAFNRSSSKGFSIGGRLGYADTTDVDTPGPGTYYSYVPPGSPSFDSRYASARAAAVSSRVPVVIDRCDPGPGSYDTVSGIGKQVVSTRPSSPAYELHSRVATAKTTDATTPGPGTYYADLKRNLHTTPTLKGREKFGSHISRHDGPGPGAYHVSPIPRQSPPKFSFANTNSSRGLSGRTDAPGPGAYDAKLPSNALAFSVAGKVDAVIPRWENDGPGVCRSDSAFGFQVASLRKSAPSFSMGGRHPFKAADATPGPGAYMEMPEGVTRVALRKKQKRTTKRRPASSK